MCKNPKDTKPTSQNRIEPNFTITISLLSLSFSYNPPPSFHFSMIRGENFANSIANRMSVMPPWLNPRDVFRLFIFKTLVVSVAATVALAEIVGYGRVVPIVKAHLEYTAVAIAVCRRRQWLPSLSRSSTPSRCSRVASAPLPSSYFLPRDFGPDLKP